MKTFYTHKRNFKVASIGGSIEDAKPSKTIKGEATSIQQLFARTMAGVPLPEAQPANYFDVDDIEAINEFYRNPRTTDLTDLDRLRNHVTNLKDGIEKHLKAEKERKEAEDTNQLDLLEDEPKPEPKPKKS